MILRSMTTPLDPVHHGLLSPAERPSIPGGGPQRIGEVIDRTLATAPERTALVGRNGRFSYAELDREADRAAFALTDLGVRQGARVAACLPNDVDIVVALLGAQRLGAIWVGINRALAPREKVYQLADCGASVLLASPDAVDEIAGERSGLPELQHAVRVAHGVPSEWHERLRAAGDPGRPVVAIDPHAPAAIAYTSGTTGHAKGAVHSHHNLLLVGAVAHATGRYGASVSQGAVLPLTILNIVVLTPLTAFQDGSSCIAIDRVDPEGIADWLERESVGHFAGVPTIFHDLLTHPRVRTEQLASLIRPEVGGAVCPEAFRTLYRERFGAEVTIGYGMAEAPTVVTRTDGGPSDEAGLCGRPVPQVDVVILGEDDRVLPAGEVGEICVAPARSGDWAGVYTPMLGYWNRAEETREALRGGMYHSGDLGVLGADGNLTIRGRRNELILRGGANVYPAEVERVLEEHPAVAAAAALGVPDVRLGERVVAAVELQPGRALSLDELAAHSAGRLARYKLPDEVAVVAELPRNAMRKVLKRGLVQLFASPIEEPRLEANA